jgi:hypothetical protein
MIYFDLGGTYLLYYDLVIFLMEKWLNEKGIAEFHMDGT